jgi:molybdenum cofactor cytidylyltransferase
VRPAVLKRYLEPEPPPLRDVLRDLGDACGSIEAKDPAVLMDLDTPSDVMGALRTLPRFFK